MTSTRTLIIDLTGLLHGVPEEVGVRLQDDLRLHELNAALGAINDAVESVPSAQQSVRRLFTQALAEFVAESQKANGLGIVAIAVDLERASPDTMRIRFEFVSELPE